MVLSTCHPPYDRMITGFIPDSMLQYFLFDLIWKGIIYGTIHGKSNYSIRRT